MTDSARAQSTPDGGLQALMKRSASERIVIAGRQRMLAEGMAANLCFRVSGIDDEAARRELYTMWKIFGWYHLGLRNGNEQLGLIAEADTEVLASWAQMDMVWSGLSGLYEQVIIDGQADPATFATVLELTDTVTDAATQQVAALRGAYADQLGPRGFGSALLLDLYERQRMLAQKIAKDVCMSAQRVGGAVWIGELEGTLRIFEASMDAFEKGMADAGVPPPATPQIAEHLAVARAEWQGAAALAQAAAAGQVLSVDEMAAFARAMDRYIAAMTGAINAQVAVGQR